MPSKDARCRRDVRFELREVEHAYGVPTTNPMANATGRHARQPRAQAEHLPSGTPAGAICALKHEQLRPGHRGDDRGSAVFGRRGKTTGGAPAETIEWRCSRAACRSLEQRCERGRDEERHERIGHREMRFADGRIATARKEPRAIRSRGPHPPHGIGNEHGERAGKRDDRSCRDDQLGKSQRRIQTERRPQPEASAWTAAKT